MQIISGKTIADEIKVKLKESNGAAGISPCLAIINIGDNKENLLYIGLKKTAVDAIGGQSRIINLAEDTQPEQLLEIIQDLNRDAGVDGILLQLPLSPALEAYREEFLQAIVSHKDVDGFSPLNRGLLMGAEPAFISCAAMACMDVCHKYLKSLEGKKVLLVGNSFDVIQPLALMFIKEACEVNIIPRYYPAAMQDIDIAVVEHGAPLVVKKQGIKPGALLIDAGFHWHQEKVCGNVDRDELADAEGYLLPVPGGMGPLLIAQLMENLCKAARKE